MEVHPALSARHDWVAASSSELLDSDATEISRTGRRLRKPALSAAPRSAGAFSGPAPRGAARLRPPRPRAARSARRPPRDKARRRRRRLLDGGDPPGFEGAAGDEPAVGRRDVDPTRERIVVSTLELHGAGIRETSLEEVATKAGVPVETIESYFPTVDDLVKGCGQHVFTSLRLPPPERAAEIFAGASSDQERLRRLIETIFDVYEREAESLQRGRRDRADVPLVDEALDQARRVGRCPRRGGPPAAGPERRDDRVGASPHRPRGLAGAARGRRLCDRFCAGRQRSRRGLAGFTANPASSPDRLTRALREGCRIDQPPPARADEGVEARPLRAAQPSRLYAEPHNVDLRPLFHHVFRSDPHDDVLQPVLLLTRHPRRLAPNGWVGLELWRQIRVRGRQLLFFALHPMPLNRGPNTRRPRAASGRLIDPRRIGPAALGISRHMPGTGGLSVFTRVSSPSSEKPSCCKHENQRRSNESHRPPRPLPPRALWVIIRLLDDLRGTKRLVMWIGALEEVAVIIELEELESHARRPIGDVDGVQEVRRPAGPSLFCVARERMGPAPGVKPNVRGVWDYADEQAFLVLQPRNELHILGRSRTRSAARRSDW